MLYPSLLISVDRYTYEENNGLEIRQNWHVLNACYICADVQLNLHNHLQISTRIRWCRYYYPQLEGIGTAPQPSQGAKSIVRRASDSGNQLYLLLSWLPDSLRYCFHVRQRCQWLIHLFLEGEPCDPFLALLPSFSLCILPGIQRYLSSQHILRHWCGKASLTFLFCYSTKCIMDLGCIVTLLHQHLVSNHDIYWQKISLLNICYSVKLMFSILSGIN